MEITSMTCRQCGGKLTISRDADQIICQHCGTEYLISFNEGAISVKLLSEGLKKIQVSTDKTASELALARIKEEKKKILDQMEGAEQYLSQEGVSFLRSENWDDPEKFLSLCQKKLEKEESIIFLFSNKELISDMKALINFIKNNPSYQQLVAQEKYHREIVNKS